MTATTTEWHQRASGLRFRNDAFIDGRFVPAASGQRFDTVNPATDQVLAAIASCDSADVDRAVQAARRAFESGIWSRAAPSERRLVLRRLADAIRENGEEFALLDSLDMGKPISEALGIDVPFAASVIEFYAEAVDKLAGEVPATPAGDMVIVTREPVGVVGAVVPWNYPLDMCAWKIGPALAAGNSVVLKPAEQSPLSALRLAELAAEVGLPDGVLNVIPGYGETAGAALGRHMDVDCIAFTGSTETGKRFLTYAGESNLKSTWLECGGKSPNLVFADAADLDTVAEHAVLDIFATNQGEICSAASRLLVHEAIHDELVERIRTRAAQLRPGDPLDTSTKLGALVDRGHLERVLGYVEYGRNEAELALGGSAVQIDGAGCFLEPTLFDRVHPTARIAQEEIFGPVLSVLTFHDEDEALAVANGTIYGLAGAVWTSDISRALRVASALRAGTVSVNTIDRLSPQTPFGGFKQSGTGRDLSLHALDKFTAWKTTWISY
jgi:4-(gamma-glutamylamino)butanal dehydrogenase